MERSTSKYNLPSFLNHPHVYFLVVVIVVVVIVVATIVGGWLFFFVVVVSMDNAFIIHLSIPKSRFSLGC